MFSIATVPAKQSVGETITTLSGRLGSASLLEDRRGAILGLRSFAKEFPATVASEALRNLIGSLSQDGDDVDTVKVVLETLLMLFNPNEDSPEASEEVALWLADEFTQRQENITLLLDFLGTEDFYSRLYSLQLLVAILSARTERTEECVFTAPLGISRLVAVLDDTREAVRNEALTLLTFLTPTSLEIQKLVAFENAFDRIFAIIKTEGALAEGGRTVEDCLIFLANLLRRNHSNQSLFRESGYTQELIGLLGRFLEDQKKDAELSDWAEGQKNRNVYAYLAIIRLFLLSGSVGTSQNQTAFWKHGLVFNILQLAFSHGADFSIKAEALITCGDIMRGNSFIQENFAQLMVPSPLEASPPPLTEGQPKSNSSKNNVYVIDGLLDLTLNIPDLASFDMRFAACECLKAYFFGHTDVRLHFLGRAIDGYRAGHAETSNILNVLLHSSDESAANDPYRYWFASIIAFHLLHDNATAKTMALAVTEGDAEKGEEVVSSVQTVVAHLTTSLRKKDDDRIIIGYLMLLLGWLFEDLDAVNDFLAEGSNIQGLIQAAAQPAIGREIVQGLCAMLLGVVYEFSTKDSPISRAKLHLILSSRFDRDRYLDCLSKLRAHPAIRDFEVTSQKADLASGVLPDIFFDRVFLDFLKDNYNRISRAIDREPSLEVSVVTDGVQKGISRELVDSLREQLDAKVKMIDEAQVTITSAKRRLEQEQAHHYRSKQAVTAETAKAKIAQEGLQRSHEADLRKIQSQHSLKMADFDREVKKLQAQIAANNSEHEENLKKSESQASTKTGGLEKEISRLRDQALSKAQEHQRELEQAKKISEHEMDRTHRRTEAATADLKATISRLKVDLIKAEKSRTQALETMKEEQRKLLAAGKLKSIELEKQSLELKEELDGLEKSKVESELRHRDLEKQLGDLNMQLRIAHKATEEARALNSKVEANVLQMTVAKDQTQAELDDLLIVFGDLEDRSKNYKARLQSLGELVSDNEENSNSDEEQDDEEQNDGAGESNDVTHESDSVD